MARRRLAVDWQACKAHGVCAELLPEIVQLDEWGYPLIAPGPVPAELRGYAQRAVKACPVLALRLVDAEEPPRRPVAQRMRRGRSHCPTDLVAELVDPRDQLTHALDAPVDLVDVVPPGRPRSTSSAVSVACEHRVAARRMFSRINAAVGPS